MKRGLRRWWLRCARTLRLLGLVIGVGKETCWYIHVQMILQYTQVGDSWLTQGSEEETLWGSEGGEE